MNKLLVQGQLIDPHDFELSKRIAETLNKHYSGHTWGVGADHKTGVVQIQCAATNGRFGVELDISEINSDPNLRGIVIAGGEILERSNLARGKFDEDAWRSAPRDFMGNLVGEHG